MRRSFISFASVGLTIAAVTTAKAMPRDDRTDEEIAERRRRAQVAEPEEQEGPPEARTGFQLGFRSGVSIPLGRVSDVAGDAMGNTFSLQVPLLLELGAKPWDHLFIGGYLGVGFGPSATGPGAACSSCTATSLRYGIEVIASLRPAESANPWLGYGIGMESSGIGGDSGTLTLFGPEFARLMAGVDFRLSRKFGIGPLVEFSVGRYGSYHVDRQSKRFDRPGALPAVDGDVEPGALHHWLTFGIRFVAFP